MRISIITIAYNSEKTIRSTIESILLQSYKDIEYIVIDGKSSDSTLDIVKEYEPKFKGRIRIVSEKDNGIYDAMNKGINLASGEVVGILNSDDFYTDNFVIEKIAEAFIKDKSLGSVYGNLHFVCTKNLEKQVRYYSSKYCKPYLFRLGMIPAHPTFFCTNECYKKYGLYDTTFDISGDYDLMIRFLRIYKVKYKYLDCDMVTMRIGGASGKNIKTLVIDNNKNIIRACKNNHIYTNVLFISLRYIPKIISVIKSFLGISLPKKTGKEAKANINI